MLGQQQRFIEQFISWKATRNLSWIIKKGFFFFSRCCRYYFSRNCFRWKVEFFCCCQKCFFQKYLFEEGCGDKILLVFLSCLEEMTLKKSTTFFWLATHQINKFFSFFVGTDFDKNKASMTLFHPDILTYSRRLFMNEDWIKGDSVQFPLIFFHEKDFSINQFESYKRNSVTI